MGIKNNITSQIPRVSILMPVFNGMPYIQEAVESIQNQTYSNWELIIIDDCSTDTTAEFLYQIQDKRIRLITNKKNLGPGICMARAFDVSASPYIARLDSDDIALPDRLEKQVDFLVHNLEYGMVGGGCFRIKENGHIKEFVQPTCGSTELKWKLFFVNPFIASTVMFRASYIRNKQITFPTLVGTEDYELWTKIAAISEVENLSIPLAKYRLRESGLSHTNRQQMIDDSLNISFSFIQKTFPTLVINKSILTDLRKWRKRMIFTTPYDRMLASTYLKMLRMYLRRDCNQQELAKLRIKERKLIVRELLHQRSFYSLVCLMFHLVRL